MDLKAKVLEILEKESYTFTELADYLQKKEDQLDGELNDKTLELRSLEAISKALRVPLYSFFRSDDYKIDFNHKPYYINKIWTGDDKEKSIFQLQEEINLLRQIIALKEDQMRKLS